MVDDSLPRALSYDKRRLADILRSIDESKTTFSYSHYVNEEVNVLHIVIEK